MYDNDTRCSTPVFEDEPTPELPVGWHLSPTDVRALLEKQVHEDRKRRARYLEELAALRAARQLRS